MNRSIAGLATLLVLSELLLPATGNAEPASGLPTPAAAPPSVIGAPLFPSDPCTSISAIVTRPTVVNSVCTVRPGHVLLETGYQNLSMTGTGRTLTYPQTDLRIGTGFHAVEFDLTPPSYEQITGAGGTISGSSDTALGFKYFIGTTPRFAYGVQLQVTLPTGGAGITANGSELYGSFNYLYTLSPVFSLGGTLFEQSTTNGPERWGQFISALALEASLPASNGAFAEVATFTSATGPGSSALTQYKLGVTHDFGQRLQIDLEGGLSPTLSPARYRFLGFGASYYL